MDKQVEDASSPLFAKALIKRGSFGSIYDFIIKLNHLLNLIESASELKPLFSLFTIIISFYQIYHVLEVDCSPCSFNFSWMPICYFMFNFLTLK